MQEPRTLIAYFSRKGNNYLDGGIVNLPVGNTEVAGKTILPFCTHEGSGLGQSERDIKQLCPGARVLGGLAIRGGGVQKAERAIAAWLKEARVLA